MFEIIGIVIICELFLSLLGVSCVVHFSGALLRELSRRRRTFKHFPQTRRKLCISTFVSHCISQLCIIYAFQDHGNYAFGYDIVDHHGAKNFRKESGDAWGNKVGSYGIHDIDGRLRIVDYVSKLLVFQSICFVVTLCVLTLHIY